MAVTWLCVVNDPCVTYGCVCTYTLQTHINQMCVPEGSLSSYLRVRRHALILQLTSLQIPHTKKNYRSTMHYWMTTLIKHDIPTVTDKGNHI